MMSHDLEGNASGRAQLLNIAEAAKLTRIPLHSFYKRDYRKRIGLPTVKIGKRLFFKLSDVEDLIGRSRELLHGEAANDQTRR
jgi:Helix-turn-helix domain